MRVFYGRTTISVVAMQCVFCVFWQDSDISCSDAMRIFFWPDNDINGGECFVHFDRTAILMVAMQCVFFVAGQRYQLQRCNNACFYGQTTISKVAMQCVFCEFWQDSDINGSDAMRVFLFPDNDINGSECFVYFDRTAILMVAMQCVFFMA